MNRIYLKSAIANIVVILTEIYGSTYSIKSILESEKELLEHIKSLKGELKEVIKNINEMLEEAKSRKIDKHIRKILEG